MRLRAWDCSPIEVRFPPSIGAAQTIYRRSKRYPYVIDVLTADGQLQRHEPDWKEPLRQQSTNLALIRTRNAELEVTEAHLDDSQSLMRRESAGGLCSAKRETYSEVREH